MLRILLLLLPWLELLQILYPVGHVATSQLQGVARACALCTLAATLLGDQDNGLFTRIVRITCLMTAGPREPLATCCLAAIEPARCIARRTGRRCRARDCARCCDCVCGG